MFKKILFIGITILFSFGALADPGTKTKFYNFDDLIINGEHKKPQILYTDARQKVKFER